MKKWTLILILAVCTATCLPIAVGAQCAICTRNAQQMGEKPAKALNAGIIYLAAAPLLIFAYIGLRWWRSNREP
jgi:hypothetical protein